MFVTGGARSRVLDVEPSFGTFGGIHYADGFNAWNGGARATRRMLLSGGLFDAQCAHEIGIVDVLADPAELVGAAIASAREAGAKAPVLYGALKRSVNDPDDARDESSLQRTLSSAAAYFDDPVARGLRDTWNGNPSRRGRG